MDTVLYWFSGTGNSLMAAKALAEALGGTELISIPRAMRSPAPPARRTGVVFPVYSFGPPALVVEFLKQVPVEAGGYVFTLATNGGMVGAAHRIVRAALRARGIGLAAGWSITMPGNCIPLHAAPGAARQQKLFAASAGKVRRIAEAVRAGARGRLEDSLAPLRWLAPAVYRQAMKHFPQADRRFRATEACTHCGLCERVCPVDNVRMEDGLPQWLGHCQACCACLNWCPVEAIQYGQRTVGRRRYRHPEVTGEELAREW